MCFRFGLRRRRLCGGWLVGLLTLLFTASSVAQISAGGTPLSFRIPLTSVVPTATTPDVDHATYLAEDALAEKNAPYRIAAQLDVAWSPENSGVWDKVPDGTLWRLRIESPKAYSIALLYDRWFIPEGGTLFIYNDDRSSVIGAFTDFNNWMDGTNITGHVAGDAVTLEYFEPAQAAGKGTISVYQVVHAYRNLFGKRDRNALDDFGGSGACNVNVVCPAAADWQNERRGVGLIIENGARICSGSLINNTAQNQTPYFLTANHCYENPTAASHWIFMFNYWSSTCTPATDGPTYQTVANATLRARNSTSDFCLMQLSSNIPTSYNPYFNGWNRVDSAAARSVCLHHPDCDVMKYSLDSNSVVSDRYLGTPPYTANAHWKVVDWDIGTTEGGSSGAPLFDPNHRITGQLEGGYAACGNNSADWFGKFALSWTGGGSNSTRLSNWLDPLSSGVLTLDGLDPNMRSRIAGFVTDQNATGLSGVSISTLEASQTTTTDNAGHYALPVIPGSYSVVFSKYGYDRLQINNVYVSDNDTTPLSVSLTPVVIRTLAGQVITQTGIPLPLVKVAIAGPQTDTLMTDAGGRFTVNIPVANYSVHLSYAIHTSPEETAAADTIVQISENDTTHVVLTLPLPRTDPTAADNYGYRAYDRFDSGKPAVYDWIELNPDRGGPGTEFSFPSSNASLHFAVPFPFRFYGILYDTLTVNENGWLLPGAYHAGGSVNTAIPSNASSDPPGILAPFWDDMRSGLGNRQFRWHDAERGHWLFQFSDQRLVSPANQLHNWQVHILDPAFFPTLYGDCGFLFIYSRIDLDAMCTVGIENPAEDTGVQVLYNGSLNSQSMPIDSGAALRITTECASLFGDATITIMFYPPPPDPRDAVVHLAGRIIISDLNGYFIQDSIPAVSACGVVSLAGYERARRCDLAIIANTMNHVSFESWRLDPPSGLSAIQFDGVVTLQWRTPESVIFQNNPAVRYFVLRNDTIVSGELTDTLFNDVALPDDYRADYRIMARYSYDNTALSEPLSIEIDLNADNVRGTTPIRYALHAAYPNPFNPATTLKLDMPRAGYAGIRIYNVCGQLVQTLLDGSLAAGSHEITWNAEKHPSGTYLVVLESGGQRFIQKLLLLK